MPGVAGTSGAKKMAQREKVDPIWTPSDGKGPPVGAKTAGGAVELVLDPQKAREGSSVKHLSQSIVPATCEREVAGTPGVRSELLVRLAYSRG